MNFLKNILNILYPSICLFCGENVTTRGEICRECMARYVKESFEICDRCGNTVGKCRCGCDFLVNFPYSVGDRRFFALSFYRGGEEGSERITEKLLFRLKERGDFAEFFALEMSSGIRRLFSAYGEDISEWNITYTPRSEEKYLEFGIDQGEEVTLKIAEMLRVPFCRQFVRSDGMVQKELDSVGRRENAERSIHLSRTPVKKGGKYLLFDDIVTSGSTMSTAAGLLYDNGAAAVFPVFIARTNRKNMI